MNTWTSRDAKAKFNELLDTCVEQGAQLVTRRGKAVTVLISVDDWHRLTQSAPLSLRGLLASDENRFDLEQPNRATLPWRDIAPL